jgi:hypothetical protein
LCRGLELSFGIVVKAVVGSCIVNVNPGEADFAVEIKNKTSDVFFLSV